MCAYTGHAIKEHQNIQVRIWVRWWRWACLVTWFCCHLIAKPGKKTGAPLPPDPYYHDDIIKWKHFPRYWPFVQGIHWSAVISPVFDVFFDLHLNKRLSKQSWGWWFEMLSHPLWCHCNADLISRSNQAHPLSIEFWVILYFCIMALLKWCCGCKFHETYQI